MLKTIGFLFKGILTFVKFLLVILFVATPRSILNVLKARKRNKTDIKPLKATHLYSKKGIQHRLGAFSSFSGYEDTRIFASSTRGAHTITYEEPFFVFSFFRLLGKAFYELLYLLLFPVRFTLKNKYAVLVFLILIYAFLNYTTPGRIFADKYIDKNWTTTQDVLNKKVSETAKSLWSGFIELSGADLLFQDKIEDKTASAGSKQAEKTVSYTAKYVVTAARGLNVRSEPDSSSEKVGSTPLTPGTVVLWLGTTNTDAGGRTWYYIQCNDGRKGWVSGKYLRQEEKS